MKKAVVLAGRSLREASAACQHFASNRFCGSSAAFLSTVRCVLRHGSSRTRGLLPWQHRAPKRCPARSWLRASAEWGTKSRPFAEREWRGRGIFLRKSLGSSAAILQSVRYARPRVPKAAWHLGRLLGRVAPRDIARKRWWRRAPAVTVAPLLLRQALCACKYRSPGMRWCRGSRRSRRRRVVRTTLRLKRTLELQ